MPMKIFPREKSRIVLVCIVSVLLMLSVILRYDLFTDGLSQCAYELELGYHTVIDGPGILGLIKPMDYRIDFFGMVYEGKTKNFIDDQILCYGAYEKYVLFFMRDLAKSLGGGQIVFIDVGANVGQHSLFMSKYVHEVHAFEPYPPVLQRFRRIVSINKIKNIFIYAVGLGDKNEKKPFHEPPEWNLGTGSFINGQGRKDSDRDLELVVGDEFLAKVGLFRVDVIKLDIEGYEKLALRGLRKTLEDSRPIIVMELTPSLENPVSFKSIEDLYSTFPHDYKLLLFVDTDSRNGYYKLAHVEKINLDLPKQKYHYEVVLCPKEKIIYIPHILIKDSKF